MNRYPFLKSTLPMDWFPINWVPIPKNIRKLTLFVDEMRTNFHCEFDGWNVFFAHSCYACIVIRLCNVSIQLYQNQVRISFSTAAIGACFFCGCHSHFIAVVSLIAQHNVVCAHSSRKSIISTTIMWSVRQKFFVYFQVTYLKLLKL